MRTRTAAGAGSPDVGSIAGWAALVLALSCGAAELLAGPGYRLAWWDLGTGFQIVRWSATAALVVFVLAAIAAAIYFRRKVRRGRALFLAAAAVSVIAAAPPIYFLSRAQRLPHIHDVSTDVVDPPQFVAVLPLRAGARNPVEYDRAAAELQRQGYPDIAPLALDMPPRQAFERAGRVAHSMGWEIVDANSSDLRVEATATTLFFGFKDDIVIRVTPSGTGSRIDVRSLSRIGGSDIGANADRVRTFLARLKAGSADR